MKRYAVMLFSILFAASLLLCVGSVKVQAVTLKNPSIVTLLDDDDEEYSVTTWDCVYLGHYYQSNNNSKDQIKWRVLSVNGNDAFLLADQCLDCKPYNDTDSGATWSECSLRSWLNSTFYNAAFNSSEKGAIKSSTVINNVGENTKDWIYLLSNEEVETYSVKKITSLAIMSDMELPSTIPAYNHLNIIMVSLNKDVKFNKYFFDMYKKVTEYCGSLCIIVFEKNGALKFGTCDEINFFNKTPYFEDIAFTQWIYEDYITPKIHSFFSEISTFLNSEELLFPDIEKFIFYKIISKLIQME